MSRAERLLDLIQVLRRHRHPVSGRALADLLGISIRTLYRDIATLQGQGAPIGGEPGVGYVLQPGFLLPPLMFSEEEIEVLSLGCHWIAGRADNRLGDAARDALAKIAAVLPPALRDRLDSTAMLAGPAGPRMVDHIDLLAVRRAIRAERKLAITYRDASGATSSRTVWPLVLGMFDRVNVLVAWCELRQDFRHFRTDRIAGLAVSDTRMPRRRPALLKAWRESQGIAPPS